MGHVGQLPINQNALFSKILHNVPEVDVISEGENNVGGFYPCFPLESHSFYMHSFPALFSNSPLQ